MFEELREKARGKPNCDRCNGDGTYLFQGTPIFCENCHSRDGITAIYQTMDNALKYRIRRH